MKSATHSPTRQASARAMRRSGPAVSVLSAPGSRLSMKKPALASAPRTATSTSTMRTFMPADYPGPPRSRLA